MFDGVYFDNIDKLVACYEIQVLKHACEIKDQTKFSDQIKNIEDK